MKDYLKHHWIRITIILLIFTVSMGRFQHKMPKRQFADFHVDYFTGQRLLKGENVYDQNAYRKENVAIFKYPPLFASITALFALTTERTAATIWFTLNFMLLIVFLNFAGKMIFDEKITQRQRDWIYFWSLFLTSRFYLQNFDAGQVNIIMMTTILLGLYAASKNKDFLAGALIGFSIIVKYMGALFIPYFILKRKYKVVLYIGASLIFYSILPALFWGWERNLSLQAEFFPYLCKTSMDMYSLSDCANQSLMAMVVRFFSGHGEYGLRIIDFKDFQLGFIVGSLYILIYLLSLIPHKLKQNENTFELVDLALLFVCVAIFNPNAWMHAFIFLTFGYMYILSYLIKNKQTDKVAFSFVVLSFFFHSCTTSFFTNFFYKDFFEIYSFVTIGAIFVLAALFKIKFSPKENR